MTDQPYPDKVQDTPQIPEVYLTAIGKVSVNWGALEFLMDRVIGKLAAFEPEDPRSAILTAHMSWPQKMNVLESLVNALVGDYPHLARFDALKPLFKKAQEGRNRIVHGQWGYENGVVTKLRLTARGELKFSNDPITISDIQTIALDIGQAGLDLLKFVLNK